MIVVVCHGPSLQGGGLGEYIDSFKYVMRLPYLGDWQVPKDYGVRTSFYCAAKGKIAIRIRKDRPEIGYYLWDKHPGFRVGGRICRQLGIEKFQDVSHLIQRWSGKLSETSRKKRRTLSSGTAAILIAANKLREPIIALGCDHLKDGKDMMDNYIGSWVYEGRDLTGAKINKHGAHSLDEERKLIDEMSQRYGVSIEFK